MLLEALRAGVDGDVKTAVVSVLGGAGCDDPIAVEMLTAELWSTDVEVAAEAADALADSTANPDVVNDALAAAAMGRAQLEVRAALVLGWRHDQRALPILEREITKPWTEAYNLNRAPATMLGRLGAPGREALARVLTQVVAAHPKEPQQWSGPDRTLRSLIDGLIGLRGTPDGDGLAIARRIVQGCAWAEERLEYAVAEREGRRPSYAPPIDPIDPAVRVVPRWGMRLRRVAVAEPGRTTRFGGQPYFPGRPIWPLHPTNRLPLMFLGQIAVPESVAGDGTWLAHVFVYPTMGFDDAVKDPDFGFPVPPTAVIVHPAGLWWGPTDSLRAGPTYPYESPVEWPSEDPAIDRFKPGPQFGFVITQVDLVPGADPIDYTQVAANATTHDDWNKVGGTALSLQGGHQQRLSEGWRFLASWDAWAVGHEMGDVAHCCVWVKPDGRGLLDVDGH